jgi:hypothetical protein
MREPNGPFINENGIVYAKMVEGTTVERTPEGLTVFVYEWTHVSGVIGEGAVACRNGNDFRKLMELWSQTPGSEFKYAIKTAKL